MKIYITLIVLSVLVNLFGSSMYLGPPGLQFILTYLTVLIASILTFGDFTDYHSDWFTIMVARLHIIWSKNETSWTNMLRRWSTISNNTFDYIN